MSTQTSDSERTLFADGSELGGRMRTFDWVASPLGPVEYWPQCLRTTLSLCLHSQFPIVIFWGAELRVLYNDAYRAILVDKHPAALGQPAQQIFPEIWSIAGPLLQGVLQTGQATGSYDLLLPLARNGMPGERYFTFSYSPILDEQGTVRGIFCPVTETTERVLGERRLRESEHRLQTALAAAQMGTWEWNAATGEIHFPPETEALWGLAPGTFAGTFDAFLTALHPDDRALFRSPWKTGGEGVTCDLEYRIILPDGAVRWVVVRGRSLADSGGKGRQAHGVVMDITARKQAEEALRTSQAELAVELADTTQLQQISSQLLQEDNINALYEQILEAAVAVMRAEMGSMQMLYPEKNRLRLLAWRGFAPASADFWEWVRVDSGSTCGMALATGERIIVPDVETCEFMAGTEDLDFYRLSGVRAVQSTPLVSRSGRVVGMISTHWRAVHKPAAREVRLLDVLARQAADLIERKQAEEALRRSESELADFFENAAVGLHWVGPDGIIQRVNQAELDLLGYTVEEYLGHPIAEFHADPAVIADILHRLACGETLQDYEAQLRCKDGSLKTVLIDSNVLWEEGGFIHTRCFTRDITERKRLEEAVARHAAELQRINDELQQFAHIVSHDLSEPLRTMNNYVQLLTRRTKGKLDASTEEYMAFVTDAAQRMQQMLADLLAYTHAGQTPEFTAVDCEAVLSQVLSALQVRITERGAVITHDPLPTVPGDATRLGQALQNLIGNALKFCEEQPPRIYITAQPEGQHWQFAVRDNGIGIDPQQVGKLFQMFQRLHTRSEYPGTGMGLAICKRIIEQHSGRIWVESTPGEGSTFYFTIGEKSRQHSKAN